MPNPTLLARHGERYRRCSIDLPNTGRDVHVEHRELCEMALAGNEAITMWRSNRGSATAS